MKWISIKDQLPELDKRVLIYTNTKSTAGNSIYIAALEYSYMFKRNHWEISEAEDGHCELDEVTHWMPLPESPQEFDKYMQVKEAASYLGVARHSLTNWDKAGKINSIRHPISRYRLYKKEDLDILLGVIKKINIDRISRLL